LEAGKTGQVVLQASERHVGLQQQQRLWHGDSASKQQIRGDQDRLTRYGGRVKCEVKASTGGSDGHAAAATCDEAVEGPSVQVEVNSTRLLSKRMQVGCAV
jgi:hypothetical protein